MRANKSLKEAENTPAVKAPPSQGKRLRVVIDAGHGGVDQGARSSNHAGSQLLEKDVILSLALKLKAKLEQQGGQVIMTRATDKFVSLQDRVRIVNEVKPDCFISIHCEYQRAPARSYELSYQDQDDKSLANALNSHILKQLGSEGSTYKRVMQQRYFYVLRKVSVPATMINGDFKTLTDSQSLIVDALANGIISFGKSHAQK